MPWSDRPPAVGTLGLDLLDALRNHDALTCRELAALTRRASAGVARALALLHEARLVGRLRPKRRNPLHRPPDRWRLTERGRLELERRLTLDTPAGPRRAVFGHTSREVWRAAWAVRATEAVVRGHMRRRHGGWVLADAAGHGVCRVTFAG